MRPLDGSVVLKRFLLIFSDLIFVSKVDPGIPSLAAAPDGPDTRPRLFSHVQVQWPRGHGRLPHFNKIAVWVAYVAAHFSSVDLRLGDEFRAPRRPNLVAAPDVRHAKIEKVA